MGEGLPGGQGAPASLEEISGWVERRSGGRLPRSPAAPSEVRNLTRPRGLFPIQEQCKPHRVRLSPGTEKSADQVFTHREGREVRLLDKREEVLGRPSS